jgi:hypothetical protein
VPRDKPREDDVSLVSDRLEAGPVDPEARRRSRKRRLIRRILVITAVVVGLGGGALFVQLRSKATVITLDESVQRFRDTAASAPAVSGLPKPGVYAYTTSGEDSITVLGGSHHDYPAQTSITVSPDACGMKLRWDALGERWEEWTLCLDGPRLELHSITTYHQFFGKSDHREYFCGEDSLYRPVEQTKGATFTTTCAGADATAVGHGELVGVEFLSVGGTRVRTLHLKITITFEGATIGTRTTELWTVAQTGLPIITVSHDDLDTESPLGRTRYAEQYRSELTALEPQT